MKLVSAQSPSKLVRGDTGTEVLILLSVLNQPLLFQHLSGGYLSVGSRSWFTRPHWLSTASIQCPISIIVWFVLCAWITWHF